MPKDCQHPVFSLSRSGPDVSAYCAKCWKMIFKSKEVMAWKYSLASAFKKETEGCNGKLVKLYRTDRFVTARCMECDYYVRQSEFKLDRNSVVQPRIPTVKAVWRISPSL